MIAVPPPAAIGSLLVIAAGLWISLTPTVKSRYCIAEVQGTSMSPTMRDGRTVFSCRECGQLCELETEEEAEVSVFRCDHCKTWQRAHQPVARIPADRVVLATSFQQGDLKPGAIVAIDHPIFGLTGKRIASVTDQGYFVLGDNPYLSLDSRNARFGLVPRAQIRGIVVKILPGMPLAAAKRSR
jgi:hypothetical protein